MAGKVPPRPQASKRNRAQAKKSVLVAVRAHERNVRPKEQAPKARPSLAERFRGR